ncbi:MAG: 1-(5-phosphoribosyl)-5-amino-4-imidazole-carboxylate carboxylase, partial [Pricia sp.]|nr:1-(5-phosphoribosyl)-5-amino-4-imidazole-carboxylate carboxylase [Pricia sp.]
MDKPFNIDVNRKQRLGFDEVIYGASKSVFLLLELLEEYEKRNENVLVTKLQRKKAKV